MFLSLVVFRVAGALAVAVAGVSVAAVAGALAADGVSVARVIGVSVARMTGALAADGTSRTGSERDVAARGQPVGKSLTCKGRE